MNRDDLLKLMRRDLEQLVQTILEKYYRGRFPYGMDAVQFRTHALGMIKVALSGMVSEEDLLGAVDRMLKERCE